MTKLIVYDLDGTLVDSRADLANAVNHTRVAMGQERLPMDAIVNMVGNGMRNLLTRAFQGTDANIDDALSIMRPYYAQHLTDETRLYDGVYDTLHALQARGIRQVVLSNKPGDASKAILKALGVLECFSAVLGGDSPYPLKPDPAAVFALMAEAGATPEETAIVGDNYTDLEAGRRAGIRRFFAAYGFGHAKDEQPDVTVNTFSELEKYI